MKSISLNHIRKPFKDELKDYENTFKSIMTSNVRLIDVIAKYIVKHRGKGLRPLLVIMSAKLVGTPQENTYIVASIVELLHTASLVHDDVVDNADVRRGFPSINAVWKNKIAVLMGDYLLSKCLINATMTESLKIMQIMADTSRRLSKGELMQIEKSRKMNLTEEDYFKIISDKTAALISSASQLGAITTSDNEEDHRNLALYGENLGIAFQIMDDLLDYYGKQIITGKPVGNDFKDKKITLPLIAAFQNAQDKDIKNIKKMLKKGVNSKDVRTIIDFVEGYNGVDYARLKKDEFAQKAKDSIAGYPDSAVKQSLLNFVDYASNRTK
jgi:octaprenyl-diphosphate synthase